MERVEKLKKKLLKEGINAYFITKRENVRYIAGFTGSSGAVLITPEKNYFITDFRYVEQATKQCPGFIIEKHEDTIYSRVAELLKGLKIDTLYFEGDALSFKDYRELSEKASGVNLVSLPEIVDELREIKDKGEVEVIKKACAIADAAFNHLLKKLTPGMSEKEVAWELEKFMREAGAEDIAFETIVASGERGALPHGVASEKKIVSGEMVTLDFGAKYQGYHSDITRTVAIGEPSEKMLEIYDVVLEAQEAALQAVRPGALAVDVDRVARDIIAKAGYAEYFGHGLGHGVGLNIHEGPRLSPKGKAVLQPGMVVTIEPGIYLPGSGGVRIEDTVLVTESGFEVLTRSPKNLIIL
ncbi:M24 family metallopeptidase [Carboxydothermus hydrogenoformans]|uniref:Aminopeptidase P n=1 Tax=Carboxydothermus hydrogenoformans (strain ATCC BAA-161 / DSM 6008 / Z-2901) TaxID=246194 RepID=Q3AAZ1_CARHZ|nr:Xaa-Pro peptidase family protein [Carboxydothermus hydrogenoformans]ABB14332.1 aminopeptidase P [Carboxydothermus hydrogenoformans Z-2901]